MNMLTKAEKVQQLKDWLSKNQLDAGVVGQTLGMHVANLSPAVMLAASSKLIKVNKGTAEPDDRDNLKFSHFMGMEDFMKEKIDKDAGRLQRKAKQKIEQKKDLSWFHSGFFSPQVKSVVVGNPLSQNIEGINPLEHYDVSHRVTKLGPGGVSSTDAIPAESRDVSSSSFGFFDPFHTTESTNIGVTNYITNGVAKGRDGKLYRIMKDASGKLSWVDHETILNSKVKIPES